MVASKASITEVRRTPGYWRSLTDDELLSATFRSEDPSKLERLIDAVPSSDEVPRVEFVYDTLVTGTGRVRCVHCKKHYENHNRGFVLVFDDGRRMLVGKDCGKKIYGAEFGGLEQDFHAAETRASYLRRRETALAAAGAFRDFLNDLESHPALAIYSRARKQFNRAFPALARDLGEAVAKNGGRLYVDERVRDHAAELARAERSEGGAEGGSTTQRKRAQRDARRPIFKIVPRSVGALSGAQFFEVRPFPAVAISALAQRARSALATLAEGAARTSDLAAFFSGMAKLLSDLEGEVGRLSALGGAVADANLTLIAEWASVALGQKHRAEKGVLRAYDSAGGVALEFRHSFGSVAQEFQAPRLSASPDLAPLNDFRKALLGELRA